MPNMTHPQQQPQRNSQYSSQYGATPATRHSIAGGGRSPTHTPRQSLVGFDPLAPGSNSPQTLAAMNTSPFPSPTRKHRVIHSLDAGDLHSINKIAMEQERIRQEHNQKMRGHSIDVQLTSIKTTSPKPPTHNSGKSEKARSPSRKSRISGMFKGNRRDKRGEASLPQRSSSMIEFKRTTAVPGSASLPTTPQPLPTTPQPSVPQTDDQRLSMYPDIASDLMDLKLNKLELPALAKPSPTSFLTGKEDEVVRTSGEAAPFQMEIPPLADVTVVSRLNLFVDSYRDMDQNFDLQQWVGFSRMDLRGAQIIPQHVPIAQALLDCGEDVCLRGVVSSGSHADDRLECVIFEGQRQFLAVFRGTSEQQSKGISSKSSRKTAAPLDEVHKKVDVYGAYLEEYIKLEAKCFAILDKLTDEEPFCDVAFSGFSFGGAMATLGAFRYASARPTSRMSCVTMASPKAGFSMFQQLVKSQPNLKVIRLELGQDAKCQLPGVGGSHAGHTLVLNASLAKSEKVTRPVLAYSFGAPKPKKFGTKHPNLQHYVVALEEIGRLKLKWVKDFVGTSGKGVVVNNESRLVV